FSVSGQLNDIQEVISFFDNNKDYDVRINSIWDYINEIPEGEPLLDDTLRDDIAAIQNFSRLVGAFPVVTIKLIADGHKSSVDIAEIEKQEFTDRYTSLFASSNAAIAFYDRAMQANQM